MDRPGLRRARLAVSLLLALVLSVGCTGDEDHNEPADKTSSAQPEPTARVVPLTARVGVVTGVLSKRKRGVVVRRVGEVVDRWFESAYLGGDYPRSDFGNAFRGFTRGAAKLARADRRFMSNATVGSRIEEVTPKRKAVRVDVLSPKQHVGAATARFRLEFTTEGKVARRFVVNGRLMLTKDRRGNWHIFGYDVRRGTRPVGGRR